MNNPKRAGDYPFCPSCSVSAWLYAGQMFLLQELRKVAAANANRRMITALFMATCFSSDVECYKYKIYLITKKYCQLTRHPAGIGEF
jgi:hypothetical protein